jgi:Uroporphyrinogen decarboxylase (URO-D)
MQGNLDPALLHAAPEVLVGAVAAMLRGFGPRAPLVANLGHGMHPSHRPERLALFFEAVHALSARARAGEFEDAPGEAPGAGAARERAVVLDIAARPPRMVVPKELL